MNKQIKRVLANLTDDNFLAMSIQSKAYNQSRLKKCNKCNKYVPNKLHRINGQLVCDNCNRSVNYD